MEGNGYYAEGDQGYGDAWGATNRRNTSTAATGLYGNEAYMQRGLYYDPTAYGAGDMSSGQRMSGYSLGSMGSAQRMQASSLYGSDMGSQRMYQYGDMDTSNATQGDASYGSTAAYGAASGYGSMNQSGRRGFDDYDNSGMSQNSYKPRDTGVQQKRQLSTYEKDMALLQGGSYAGSSPYGKDNSKRRNFEDNYSGSPKQAGNYNSLGLKGSLTYKAVAPPEVGSFAYDYDKSNPQKRQFGYQDSGSRNSLIFDDNRYRLGSGGAGGGFAGRGRGRGRGRNAGDNSWQNKGQKRNETGFGGAPWPKKKKAPPSQDTCKNPISFLNEIRPDTDFIVSDMEGPSNMPTFKVSLQFDGQTYTASAKSKKLAKRYVSEAALRAYLKTPAARQLGYNESHVDFGEAPEGGVLIGHQNAVTPAAKPAVAQSTNAKPEDLVGGKNPVMYLNELKKDAVYDLKEETGDAHSKKFIMRVTVSGQQFEGEGQNKKLAKAAAARKALSTLGLAKQA